jgi:hypothetical protein
MDYLGTLRPAYSGGSILNLMVTLAGGLGLTPGKYAPLAPALGLSIEEVAQARHVVLLVIDGLGEVPLQRAGVGGLLRYQAGTLTSVFPSTTASAIPTFLSGLAPQQHALTGWHMWFEEIGETLAVLPLQPRSPKPPDEAVSARALPERLGFAPPLLGSLGERCTFVTPRRIAESPFNSYYIRGPSASLPFDNLAECFTNIVAAVREGKSFSDGPRLIHAYLPDLDALMHEQGTRSDEVAALMQLLGEGLEWIVSSLCNTGTLVVVTADHGFIDAPPDRLIEFEPDSAFSRLLSRPLCGERRIAYAYVDPAMRERFQDQVNADLAEACQLYTAEEFMAAGWFGPGAPHPRLRSRIGDYVLLMREDWTIKDWLPTEKRYSQRGVHGGASIAEMLVPLLVVRP